MCGGVKLGLSQAKKVIFFSQYYCSRPGQGILATMFSAGGGESPNFYKCQDVCGQRLLRAGTPNSILNEFGSYYYLTQTFTGVTRSSEGSLATLREPLFPDEIFVLEACRETLVEGRVGCQGCEKCLPSQASGPFPGSFREE